MAEQPALSPDEINARFLERSAQQALARANANAVGASTYDVAWSALLDLVEIRARKMFPNRFDPPASADTPSTQANQGAVPHVSRVSTS